MKAIKKCFLPHLRYWHVRIRGPGVGAKINLKAEVTLTALRILTSHFLLPGVSGELNWFSDWDDEYEVGVDIFTPSI